MNSRMTRPVLFSLLLAVAVLHPAAAQERGLDPARAMMLRSVYEVHVSPDGSHRCFVTIEPRGPGAAPGGASLQLFAVPGEPDEEPRRLLAEDANPRGVAYTPDGRHLVYVARRGGEAAAQVWALPLAGGESRPLFRCDRSVSAFAVSPDGKRVAYTSLDPMPPARAAAQKAGFKPIVYDEDWRHVSLWLHDLDSGEERRLTEGVTIHDFAFSPDGGRIAVAAAPRNLTDDSYMLKRLHLIDLATGAMTPIVDNPGKLGPIAWSPDGKTLAYVSAADRRDPHAGMLYEIAIGAKAPRALTPSFEGMVHQVEWEDDGHLLLCTSEGLKTFVTRLDRATGAREHLAGGAGIAFHAFARLPGRDAALVVGSSASHPEEVVELGFGADGAVVRRTDLNPDLAAIALGRQENVRFAARDGLEIEGLLIHPVGEVEGRRYPLVIVAHGGPESHYSEGWVTRYSEWGQMLAARGYVVWYPNYRSSTGRGVAFAKKDHGDPMGAEFEDHLDAIAHFAKQGLIDPKRVGLGGGSYGGYTAAWAATRHSEHFAAAVSFVPFVDIRTKWLTSDIPIEFHRVHYEEKWPHEQAEFLASRSPLTFAPQCRTPLLLVGGTSDPRVHPSQPHMLYRAVQTATKTPVRYVQYEGEGHGNRVNTNRYDYCLRALRWFDHYLGEGAARDRALPPVDIEYPGWVN
ncbi:MAG: alpha/beta fold hydrolase [Planctomycetota bacterium]